MAFFTQRKRERERKRKNKEDTIAARMDMFIMT